MKTPVWSSGRRPPADPRAGAALGWRRLLLMYGVWAAGVAAATWPLVLEPSALWPPHHDARVFTWVMASVARRLVAHPMSLFQGNAFYPFGESLAYTELLLPPALLGLPGFLWGNPILTYNLLLLGLWPLNGVAMAWVTHRLTGSSPAAWLAGTVFCLAPYFTEYYLEFQMLLAAPLPLVLFAWVRWLETLAGRWLALGLAGLVVQAWTSWYYAIILGVGLLVLSVGFGCLRWRAGVARGLLGGALGVLAAGALLLPFAWPYLEIRLETGYERQLEETARHSADLATFVEPGRRSLLYRFAPSGHIAETSAFPGFTIFLLAAVSLLWLRTDAPRRGLPAILGRAVLVALLATLALLAWVIRFPDGPSMVRLGPRGLMALALVLGLACLTIRPWSAGGLARTLGRGDWVRLLLVLAGVSAALALGPVIQVARTPVGPGLYASLYPVLLPLHAIRVTVRFAVLIQASLALLAGLGLVFLEERLDAAPLVRHLVTALIFVTLALEYAVAPARYEPVRWAPRPVDEVLRTEAADAAVLEWPINRRRTDSDAMLRSLWHGKPIVNGLAGFVPGHIAELSRLLTGTGALFPNPETEAALRRIYPLRYLVVRLAEPGTRRDLVQPWLDLRQAAPPILRFRGTFGTDDLYEVVPLPERGVRFERWVSHEIARRRPVLELEVRPLVADPGLAQWVDVLVDGDVVQRIPLPDRAVRRIALPPPAHRVVPNRIELAYGYRRLERPDASRYRIGATGAVSPGDLRVLSAGYPHGNTSSIRLDGTELSPDGRGYNLVALGANGRPAAAVFDTFATPAPGAALARWVRDLPSGTVVVGSVRDEASAQLTADAVAALRTLGITGDLRGHFRESHAFIGVKDAAPGTALERLGPRPVELSVGSPRLDVGCELVAFALVPRRAKRPESLSEEAATE